MLLICKLSALAYCYKDGGEDEKNLTEEQKKWKVVQMPNLLEFASYVFFCNASALGVFFEYSDYKRFIEQTHEYKNAPSPVLPSLYWLAQGFTWIAIFVVGSNYFYLPDCWSEWYSTLPWWKAVLFYHIAMSIKRFFYYGPFSITTGAVIASGLGYNGIDHHGKHHWNKIVQVYVYEIETGKSPNELLRYWNHQVHLWLKFYIGARITEKDKRPTFGQNMIVFMVSAFWHGFYPFYYVTFFLLFLFTEVAKDLYKGKKYLFYGLIPFPFVRHFLAN
jgi:lysophospholipid acyltransferase